MSIFNLQDIDDDECDFDLGVSGCQNGSPDLPHPLIRLWVLRILACLDEKRLQADSVEKRPCRGVMKVVD